MMHSKGQMITVIGRGHSGTRALSHTFQASRVYMGPLLNESGDVLPANDMYEACRIIAEHIRWTGGLTWDFDKLHEMRIDPRFEDLVRHYLRGVMSGKGPNRGWKLPETTLAYPWIVRMFPTAKYVHIVRDPRDGLLKAHRNTDDLAKFDVSYPETEDEMAKRVASWKYQHEIVKATPRPQHFLSIRFEDLVLDYERTMQQLEAFLGIPLARIVMDRTRVGQWKTDQRIVPYIGPIAGDMRELGYDVQLNSGSPSGQSTAPARQAPRGAAHPP
jgi:sulfotransferase family protein